jgi:uncharacterized membrane protein
MHPLEKLATVFFNIFGITQPSASALGRATWFLMAMLTLVAVAVVTGGWLVYRTMHVV